MKETTVAGITMSLKKVQKLNNGGALTKEDIGVEFLRNVPTFSNIFRVGSEVNNEVESEIYEVDIMQLIPANDLSALKGGGRSGIYLNDEKTLLLRYGGNVVVPAEKEGEYVNCREFGVVYECSEKLDNGFDLYRIQFTYKLPYSVVSAEALLANFENLDPVMGRGTVVRPRL